MNRYSSFRYQAVLEIIIYRSIIICLIPVFHFFGGFDDDEFIELVGLMIMINTFYVFVLFLFKRSRNWFLPNPSTFDRDYTRLILGLVGLLIIQKAFTNAINFTETMTTIKVLELILLLLGLKKKKTPSGL
ncbi:MAG: hypothetical protein KBC12_01460 [Candidatus Pacebacteria bacterium]|nr:hypothetical protein [Candidatus Paceibacterota bacterium]MBP9851475.1 hypothetical protein [Candidatus Paceibacterota bacterium]